MLIGSLSCSSAHSSASQTSPFDSASDPIRVYRHFRCFPYRFLSKGVPDTRNIRGFRACSRVISERSVPNYRCSKPSTMARSRGWRRFRTSWGRHGSRKVDRPRTILALDLRHQLKTTPTTRMAPPSRRHTSINTNPPPTSPPVTRPSKIRRQLQTRRALLGDRHRDLCGDSRHWRRVRIRLD
jgi:hypothetical protein